VFLVIRPISVLLVFARICFLIEGMFNLLRKDSIIKVEFGYIISKILFFSF
jgi:hypothetical protein